MATNKDYRDRQKALAAKLGVVPYAKTAAPKSPKSVLFLRSAPWLTLRMVAFERYGNKCQCCGASPSDGAVLQVDHVKPRSKYPELELNIENLQILCRECNIGKGAWSQTDWRDS
jgi:5-methylcytosine-specific restriction endonuclease McrA